jgi:uncharacterized membrane protein
MVSDKKTSNHQIKREIPDFPLEWRSWRFWRNSFIYFWVFSFVGHLAEYLWYFVVGYLDPATGLDPANLPFFVLAAPYGFGVIGILWFILPIIRKRHIGVVKVFVLSTLITTVIEFICALMLVVAMGHNPYWDYSRDFLNLFGFTCLRNSIAFGFASLAFIYFVFPFTDRLAKRLSPRFLNVVFWVLFVSYILAQISRFFGYDPILG